MLLSDLPSEVISHIFKHLHALTLQKMSLVSRWFYGILKYEHMLLDREQVLNKHLVLQDVNTIGRVIRRDRSRAFLVAFNGNYGKFVLHTHKTWASVNFLKPVAEYYMMYDYLPRGKCPPNRFWNGSYFQLNP